MRILIADSQSKVRRALSVLLKQQEGLEIIGEASDAEELLSQVAELRPDLVLFHWRLSGATVEDLLPALRAACPGVRVLALSARPESSQEALACGADAFVCKIDQPEHLLATIQSIRAENAGHKAARYSAGGDEQAEKGERIRPASLQAVPVRKAIPAVR